MTEIFTLTYNCGPVALKFHRDKLSRVKLLIGPFGTGKTSSGAYDQIMCQSKRVLADKHGVKRTRFAVVRNTYPQLRDTTIKTVLEWFPPEVFGGEYKETAKELKLRINDGDGITREIEIIFRALDNDKDVRNLLSLELTGAWGDEAREIKSDIIKGLLGRIGRFPSVRDFDGQNPFTAPPQLVLTTNYPSTEHYLYRDFVEARIDGYTIYEQGQAENAHNLRPGYYADLEKDYADRPDLLKTLVRGSWGVTVRGKLVYPEFSRKVHVANNTIIPQGPVAIIRGWDNTGLSPAIALSYLTSLGQWRIFKEFCFEDTGITEATEAMLMWCQLNLNPACKFKDYGDPAGNNRDSVKKSPAQYIAEKAKDYGQSITIENGIQTFKVRRESVAQRLLRMINGEPAVLIDPSCTRIIDGFEGGYAYAEIGTTGIFKTEPEKNEYSHIHDAIQYPATRMFPVADSTPKPQPRRHAVAAGGWQN